MDNLFREPKQRYVLGIAVSYVIVGWVSIHIAGAISELMLLSVWFELVVIAFLILSFPIALVLAWAIDPNPTPSLANNLERSSAGYSPHSGLLPACLLHRAARFVSN